MSRSGTWAAVRAGAVPVVVGAGTGRAASTAVTSKRATTAVGATMVVARRGVMTVPAVTGGNHQRVTSLSLIHI